MSSSLSIPVGVNETIHAAISGRDTKTWSILPSLKIHSFTLLGIVTVALVIALGAFYTVQYFKNRVPPLNVSDEELIKNDFLDSDLDLDFSEEKDDEAPGEEKDDEVENEIEAPDIDHDENFTTLDDLMKRVIR
jgi:hypothetical protein